MPDGAVPSSSSSCTDMSFKKNFKKNKGRAAVLGDGLTDVIGVKTNITGRAAVLGDGLTDVIGVKTNITEIDTVMFRKERFLQKWPSKSFGLFHQGL